MIHIMKLSKEEFGNIESEKQKMEYRLWDEKRSKIKEGDTIIFTNEEDDRQISAAVIGLTRAHTFDELRTKLMAEGLINYKDFEPAGLLRYYSRDDQYKYGVVGIKIALVKEEVKEPDKYFERFKEQAYDTVADYVINHIIKEIEDGHPGEVWICGTGLSRCKKVASGKLMCIYTEDTLRAMAYHIQFLYGKIGEDEYKAAILPYGRIKEDDIPCLLESACKLKYKIAGVNRSTLRRSLE